MYCKVLCNVTYYNATRPSHIICNVQRCFARTRRQTSTSTTESGLHDAVSACNGIRMESESNAEADLDIDDRADFMMLSPCAMAFEWNQHQMRRQTDLDKIKRSAMVRCCCRPRLRLAGSGLCCCWLEPAPLTAASDRAGPLHHRRRVRLHRHPPGAGGGGGAALLDRVARLPEERGHAEGAAQDAPRHPERHPALQGALLSQTATRGPQLVLVGWSRCP